MKRTCQLCRNLFIPKKKGTHFCSVGCSSRATAEIRGRKIGETRRKLRIGSGIPLSESHKEKLRQAGLRHGAIWMFGKRMPEATRLAIRKANLGRRKANPITPLHKRIRTSPDYKRWRDAVFSRDNYTCQNCGVRNGKGIGKSIMLHPHHKKPFSLFADLRFDVPNGVTLCADCHRKTETYGTKLWRNREAQMRAKHPDALLTVMK